MSPIRDTCELRPAYRQEQIDPSNGGATRASGGCRRPISTTTATVFNKEVFTEVNETIPDEECHHQQR